MDLDATLFGFTSSFESALDETVKTYMGGFEKVAAAIVGLLIAIEIIKISIAMVSGDNGAISDFVKRMLVLMIVALCILNFSTIYGAVIGLNKSVVSHNEYIAQEYTVKNAAAMSLYLANKEAWEQQQKDMGFFKKIKGVVHTVYVRIYFWLCDVLMAISLFLTKIFYVFYFTKISFFLLVGPMFIAFGTSEMTSSMTKKWGVGILVNVLALVFLSAAFKLIANLNVNMVTLMANNIGVVSFGPWALLIGKFMITLGILLSVPKAAESLRYSAA